MKKSILEPLTKEEREEQEKILCESIGVTI